MPALHAALIHFKLSQWIAIVNQQARSPQRRDKSAGHCTAPGGMPAVRAVLIHFKLSQLTAIVNEQAQIHNGEMHQLATAVRQVACLLCMLGSFISTYHNS